MSTLVKDVTIPDSRQILIDLPPDTPVGQAVVELTIKPKQKKVNRLAEIMDSWKDDNVWMADDFDAPLDDFKEYM